MWPLLAPGRGFLADGRFRSHRVWWGLCPRSLSPSPSPFFPDGLNLGFGINSAGRSWHWQGIRACARIPCLGAALGNWDGAQLPAGAGCKIRQMPICLRHRSLGTPVLGTSAPPQPLPSLHSRLLGETVALAKAIEAFACWLKRKIIIRKSKTRAILMFKLVLEVNIS